MHWLNPIIDATTKEEGRTLVLCRTASSEQAVRRFLAESGGALGVTILTPVGLARSLDPPVLIPPAEEDAPELEVPADHEWRSLNTRPGLARHLAEHLADLRVEAPDLACLSAANRARVAPLLEAGWGDDPLVRSLGALRDRALAGEDLLACLGYEWCFAIGFPVDDGRPRPPGPARLLAALLSALRARRLSAAAAEEALAIPTVRASDPAAEAAWVAKKASDHLKAGGGDVLVLVPSEGDADRIRATLQRNGLPAADDGARPLALHGLATLLRSVLPWFSEEPDDAVEIDADLLRRVLLNPLLGDSDPKGEDREALLARLRSVEEDTGDDLPAADEPSLHLSRRQVPRALHACRLVAAPLSAWTAALERVTGDGNLRVSVRRCAVLIRHRLGRLGQTRGPTLGHLARFLRSLQPKHWQDAVAQGILRSLDTADKRPATEEHLDDAISGAASAGAVHRGIVLLPVAAYDDRPAGLCLVTGLHSKGLGRAPAPDPFFSEDEVAAWGRLGGAAQLDFVFSQVEAAARRAQEVAACVTATDDTGRAVVAVSDLSLHPLDETFTDYGRRVDIPERRDAECVEARSGAVPEALPFVEEGDPASRIATAATAEWVRDGACVAGATAAAGEDPESLLEHLARYGPLRPPALGRFLGDLRGVEGVGVPADQPFSATGAFEPLAHCPYQAFLKVRLRLREPETIEEELNAREIGSAVHEAIEATGKDPRWRCAAADEPSAAASLLRAIEAAFEDEIAPLVGTEEEATAALRRSRLGAAARWKRHLRDYVSERLETLEACDAVAVERVLDALDSSEALQEIRRHAEESTTVKIERSKIAHWSLRAARCIAEGGDPWDEDLLAGLIPRHVKALRKFREGWSGLPDALARLAEEWRVAAAYPLAVAAPVAGAEIEWPFGELDGKGEPFLLRLPVAGDVSVRGAVDRIRWYGAPGAQVAQILDYKTGRAGPGSVADLAKELLSGARPQLVVYALVLRQALQEGAGPKGLSPTPHPLLLAYDFVRRLGTRQPYGLVEAAADGEPVDLDLLGEQLGILVAGARAGDYRLIPLAQTCPELTGYGSDYCPYGDACRFRRHPVTGTPADEPGEGAEVTP